MTTDAITRRWILLEHLPYMIDNDTLLQAFALFSCLGILFGARMLFLQDGKKQGRLGSFVREKS